MHHEEYLVSKDFVGHFCMLSGKLTAWLLEWLCVCGDNIDR